MKSTFGIFVSILLANATMKFPVCKLCRAFNFYCIYCIVHYYNYLDLYYSDWWGILIKIWCFVFIMILIKFEIGQILPNVIKNYGNKIHKMILLIYVYAHCLFMYILNIQIIWGVQDFENSYIDCRKASYMKSVASKWSR